MPFLEGEHPYLRGMLDIPFALAKEIHRYLWHFRVIVEHERSQDLQNTILLKRINKHGRYSLVVFIPTIKKLATSIDLIDDNSRIQLIYQQIVQSQRTIVKLLKEY